MAQPANPTTEPAVAGQGGVATAEVTPTGTLASSSITGLVLETVSIERAGTTMTARFTIANDGSTLHTWTYDLSAESTAASIGWPTGVTVIDSVGGQLHRVLDSDGVECVCSPLGSLSAGGSSEYFVTFDDPGLSDFELYIPTFPLLVVRDDVVQPPIQPALVAPVADASSDKGLALEGLSLRPLGRWTVAEFEIANTSGGLHTWTYDLSAEASGNQIGLPNGITLFDPVSQTTVRAVEPAGALCACSRLGSIPAGGRGTYFVYFDTDLSGPVNVTIPGFPQQSQVAIGS